MYRLKLTGTAFLILSLLSSNAVVNADDPEYTNSLSPSTRQAFTSISRNDNPNIVDRGWLSSMQHDLAAYEYHASENGHGLQAPNRAQNLRTYFEPTGIRLYDRTRMESPELAGLSLTRLGRGSALVPRNLSLPLCLRVRARAGARRRLRAVAATGRARSRA